jgi:hypothetical protein
MRHRTKNQRHINAHPNLKATLNSNRSDTITGKGFEQPENECHGYHGDGKQQHTVDEINSADYIFDQRKKFNA